jgi:hypothetical protein
VSGNVCSFNGTGGKLIADGGKLAVNLVTDVGTGAPGNVTTYTGNRVIHDSGIALSALLTTAIASSTYMPLAGGTFSGNVAMGANAITSTGSITCNNIQPTNAPCFSGYAQGPFIVGYTANTPKLINTGTLTSLMDPLSYFAPTAITGEVKYVGPITRYFKIDILFNVLGNASLNTFQGWVAKGGSTTPVAPQFINFTTATPAGYLPFQVSNIYQLAQNNVIQLAGQYSATTNVNIFSIQVQITPMS